MTLVAITHPASLGRRLAERVVAWLAAPASARPLAAFRIGVASVLLLQALTLAGSLQELYGSLGLVQWPVADLAVPPGHPRIRWVVDALAPLGVGEAACVNGLFAVYVAGLLALLAGWHTRAAALVAWLAFSTLKASAPLSGYGLYELSTISLFYCVCLPVGHGLSLDRRRGRVPAGPSPGARLGLRVLQLHLCIVYLSSGWWKASGDQWWDGAAIWRALMRQDLGQFDFAWLAEWPWLAKLACWGTLAVELGYAVLVWPRRTRRWWVAATLGLHAGIAVMLGLWLFSALMIVLTGAAFGVSAEELQQARGPVREQRCQTGATGGRKALLSRAPGARSLRRG
jgi:hypothetical protein